MILFSRISAGCLILFAISRVSAHPSSHGDQIPDKGDEEKLLKKSFAQLLGNIVKVNEDRLAAMKTLYRLQDASVDSKPLTSHPESQPLRRGSDDYDDDGLRTDDHGSSRRVREKPLTLIILKNYEPSPSNAPSFRSSGPGQVKNQNKIYDIEPYRSLQLKEKSSKHSDNKKKKPSNDKKPTEISGYGSKQQLQALRAGWRMSCDRAASKNCFKACKSAYRASCDEFDCKRRLEKSLRSNCKMACKERFGAE